MSLDRKAEAALALHRFGLGPRAGSIAAIASDPRGALLADLDRPGAGVISDPTLRGVGAAAREAATFRQARREMRRAVNGAKQKGAVPNVADATAPARPSVGIAPQQLYLDEAKVRLTSALDAEIGFAERLAWFWSNHFCISADKALVRPIAGAFEREAIRAHLFGRFADMLLAVESHPAMLIYLDNARSIGPNSPAGLNRRRGLNENLAREILELHTLGVRSVYSQDDVTSFAKVITGWTVIGPQQDEKRGGEFIFRPRMHEPGPQAVIGKRYAEAGVEQGRRVLADLARHPATARHVTGKLMRHFVGEAPAVADRLARRFQDTDGDLRELAKALVTDPDAWSAPRARLKRPGEWLVGTLRAVGAHPQDVRPVIQAQNMLGEPLWRPPAPNGFVDDDATWLDGLSQRLDVANQFARRFGGGADPLAVFDAALAPIASEDTRRAIARAESRPQALALLLMSPEFQRR